MTGLQALLNEISPEHPCGEHLEYDAAYLALAKNILGKPEDPISGEKAQPPNWHEILSAALALLERTKDLQIVLYLIRAAIPVEGLQGFRDGLKLLLDLLEKYWDGIYPLLDPDDNFDPTARVNIIEELSNFDSVLRPMTLATLVDSKAAGRFCLRDIQIATDKIDLPENVVKPDINMIKAAFLDIPTEVLVATYQAIIEGVAILDQLDDFFSKKVGVGNGPDLSALKVLLKEIRQVFDEFGGAALALQDESATGSEDLQGDAPPVAGGPSRQQMAMGAINSRQDVIKALDLICKYYADYEPSSPVPIFLRRAKQLVTSDFMQIVENLLPDSISQLQLFKGPDSDQN